MITKATTQEIEDVVNTRRMLCALGLQQGQWVILTKFYNNPGNIALQGAAGMMLFGCVAKGIYECHFLFKENASGKDILLCARKILREMFTKYGACVIKGYPPRDNRAVRVIGRSLGFIKIDENLITDSLGRYCETYELRGSQWVQ